MQVLAKVLDVEDGTHNDKPKCDVTLKVGRQAYVVTLWHDKVKKGINKSAHKALGQFILADIEPEIRNNKILWSWGFEPDFSVATIQFGNSLQDVNKKAG